MWLCLVNMNKSCVICNAKGKYKCPTCLIYYCSAICCKKHRLQNCELFQDSSTVKVEEIEAGQSSTTSNSLDTSIVPLDKLQLLKNNEDLKHLLHNNHLQDLLLVIDKSENPEEVMQKAMQEPLFVEFADACLKVVNPRTGAD